MKTSELHIDNLLNAVESELHIYSNVRTYGAHEKNITSHF